MLVWFEHLQYLVLGGRLQPPEAGEWSARRRTGSRFRYAPSAASAAGQCLVRAFTDESLHPRLGSNINACHGRRRWVGDSG